MEGANKLITFGVGLLITVIVIGAVLRVTNKGKDVFNEGNDSLTNAVASLSSTEYDLYDGTRLLGSEVISLINSSIRDKTVEILVCTKDGSNYVYNANGTAIFGVSGTGTAIFDETSSSFLTGLAVVDAAGKSFEDGSAVIQIAPYGTSSTCLLTSSGYNNSVEMGTGGYISTSSFFNSSIQKDINGDVRRVTCVQQ